MKSGSTHLNGASTSPPAPSTPGTPSESAPPVISDLPARPVRRPADLLELLATCAAIPFIGLLGVYAHRTVRGLARDMTRAMEVVLLGPITVLEALFTIAVPITVIIYLLWRRRSWTAAFAALAAGASAALCAAGAAYLLNSVFEPNRFFHSLTVPTPLGEVARLSPVLAALIALITSTGAVADSRLLRWSWALATVVSILSVVRGNMTLPALLIVFLAGRAIGLGGRLLFGVNAGRVEGGALGSLLVTMGISPVSVRRIGGEVKSLLKAPRSGPAPALVSHARNYLVEDAAGHHYLLAVLDADQRVRANLSDLWNNLRLQGMRRSAPNTLYAWAERHLTMNRAAARAGLNLPQIISIKVVGGSALLLFETAAYCSAAGITQDPIIAGQADLSPEPKTHPLNNPQVWDRLFAQLALAHAQGLTHRAITLNALVFPPTPGHLDPQTPWSQPDYSRATLFGFQRGEVAATTVSQRIDRVQLLALAAAHIGTSPAAKLARTHWNTQELGALIGFLQPISLPPPTRRLLRGANQPTRAGGADSGARRPDILGELRTELGANLDNSALAAASQQVQLAKFRISTLVVAVVGVLAVGIVAASLNLEQIQQAITHAQPGWMLACFGFGLLTYLGAGLVLVAIAPRRLSLSQATLVQVAASVVGLVAPAGIGPLALNLRYLQKQQLPTPVAVATVGMVQVIQVSSSALLLVGALVSTGGWQGLDLPVSWVLGALGAGALAIGVVAAIPQWRRRLADWWTPTWAQVSPGFGALIRHPYRLAGALAGVLIMTASYTAAFGAALAALGWHLPVMQLFITFLVSNTLGSVVPTPGGIGPVEAALTGGLTLAGVPAAIGLSTAVIYRVLTFWARVPLGWLALQYIERRAIV